MKKILVTGGTGHLGRKVVECLLPTDFVVSILSSQMNLESSGNAVLFKGDLAANTGLVEAATDADIIIHCASNSQNYQKVDIEGTYNLLQAINKDRTKQFIYISIVGVDKSNYPYYRAKYEVEKMIAKSGVPFTILRTTQFHSFVLMILQPFIDKKHDGIIEIPAGMRFQSVDITEVAQELTNLALGDSAGLLPAFGGPELVSFETMAQDYLNIINCKETLKVINIAGERYDLFRSGVNLCPKNVYGKITWKEFLNRQGLQPDFLIVP